MSIQQLLLGASGASGYNIDKSLRFRASASANLSRTFGSLTARTNQTVSLWFKIGTLSTERVLYAGYDGSSGDATSIILKTDNTLTFNFGGGAAFNLTTSQVFRDPSAWYHLVIAYDTTQATASNRVKMYINGVQVTAFSAANYPVLNATSQFSYTNGNNKIASQFNSTNFFDGYLSEFNFIDGQALTPASFGSFNALTGVWQPAPYTGTYGTNGFYLDFETTTSVAALGNDKSGNGNTWTVNNISLTAGVTYDSMTDVPTLTSATAANYAVLNPLAGNSNLVLSNGNLQGIGSGAGVWNRTGTMQIPSGKWYWETGLNGGSGSDCMFGIVYDPNDTSISTGVYTYQGASGNKYTNGVSSGYGASYTNNDVIGIAFDSSAGSITFYKNGVSQGTAFTGITGSYFPFFRTVDTLNFFANFGQRPFTYTPPTGFVALNTFNLPTATILKGNTQMDATLYTGNGSTQTITNAAGFQPDFVWLKSRSAATSHQLFDIIRGTNRILYSNLTNQEDIDTDALTAFNSNGFSIGAEAGINTNTATYVGWQWQAGGAAVTNTSGTISAQVSASPTAGFSVVTYTGTGANATVGHGLGVAPSLIIVKRRNSTANWNVYHTSVGATGVLLLNTTDSTTTTSLPWNNTAPTSSVFTVGTGNDVNASGGTFVAYCWTAISGFSAMGSYVGNANADGPFVFTGFRPKYVLIKRSTGASDLGNWILMDTERNPYNVSINRLFPNTSNAENGLGGSGDYIDILSNGFKVRGSGGWVNQSGSTMVYICYAENPFKNSLAR